MKDDVEYVDQQVEQIFSDYQNEILQNGAWVDEYHIDQYQKRNTSLIKIIDNNHIYCAICNEHFYAKSDLEDRNSGFQKHINTSYHKISRVINPLPDKVPTFTWEKCGKTAYCNVCKMFGLKFLVFNTGLKETDLKKLHNCSKNSAVYPEHIYMYKEIIKKFSSLNVFISKFGRKYYNKMQCCLCNVLFEDSKQKVKYHFMSDLHSQFFLKFIEDTFSLKFRDLLNGFHMEQVFRWILTNKLSFKEAEAINCCEEKFCLEESNSTTPLYYNIKSQHYLNNIDICANDFRNLQIEEPKCFLQKENLSNVNDNTCDKQNTTKIQNELQILKNNSKLGWRHKNEVLKHKKTYKTKNIENFNNCRNSVSFMSKQNGFGSCSMCRVCFATVHELQEHYKKCSTQNLLNTFQKKLTEIINSYANEILRLSIHNMLSSTNESGIYNLINSGKLDEGNATTAQRNVATLGIKGATQGYCKNHKDVQTLGTLSKVNENAGNDKGTENFKPKFADIKTNRNKCIFNKEKKSASSVEEMEEPIIIVKNYSQPKNASILRKTFEGYFERFTKFSIEKDDIVFIFPTVALAKEAAKKEIVLNNVPLKIIFKMRRKRKEKMNAVNDILHPDTIRYLSKPEELKIFLKDTETLSDLTKNQDTTNLIINKILCSTQSLFPYSRCHIFGSTLTSLTQENSDIDIFFDCDGDMYRGDRILFKKTIKNLIYRVAHCIKKNQMDFQFLSLILGARVPILTFKECTTNVKCDLSFSSGLSVQNSLMLRLMVSLDSRVRPLTLFLKRWITDNKFHGKPTFTSYSLSLMIIFFLQQLPNPVLPTIEFLQINHEGPRLTVKGWDCSINTPLHLIPETSNKDSVPQLILGFFKFYSEFNFNHYVVSPLTGNSVSRKSFIYDVQSLPMAYKRHFHNIPPGSLLKEKDAVIWVADPFDLTHNVTSRFPKKEFNSFIDHCKESVAILQTHIF